ncbi:putative serine/threonine-protein kinase-like protein CCR3 [Miscanthus floridulus]|uniref:putative serine/threonine-protein kinase-like protein CCR3 n=1 Tax=Miscanthus floridulus TaxID=154761 RepID=UPI00345A7322
MWGVLGNAATVAQLAGFDAAGFIAKIRQAARTAQQNNKDCELLAHRVDMLGELLPRLMRQDPEAVRALAGLDGTLSEAHDLVMSCQGRGRTYKFFTASRMADRFRDVEKKIDSYLSLIPAISYICITSRLDANHTTSRSQSQLVLEESGVEGREFTLAEIAVATNNFAVLLSDDADSGTKVYKGKLHNGPEVAVKRLNRTRQGAEDAFFKEQHILSPLRNDHIVCLLGTCADDGERMLVTQYMPNGSLYDHLHGCRHQSSSPVTTSWKSRVEVLLGAARAVEHLHCHSVPLIIHGNVASSNVLLDAASAPRLSGFGASVWRAAGVASQAVEVAGARSCSGYADPEYCSTGHIKPASDVYGLGVVMLEVLTGQPPVVSVWDEAKRSVVPMSMASFALPSIQTGRLGDVLDRRPAPQPTTWQQLQPLQLVANMAVQCLCLRGDNRPAISDVVANLEQALRLI